MPSIGGDQAHGELFDAWINQVEEDNNKDNDKHQHDDTALCLNRDVSHDATLCTSC
jgi:hypothetical protein